MYKFCLLTAASRLCDIEAGSDGSGAGGSAASTKSWLVGETPKRPATLWSVAYRLGHKLPRPPATWSVGKAALLLCIPSFG